MWTGTVTLKQRLPSTSTNRNGSHAKEESGIFLKDLSEGCFSKKCCVPCFRCISNNELYTFPGRVETCLIIVPDGSHGSLVIHDDGYLHELLQSLSAASDLDFGDVRFGAVSRSWTNLQMTVNTRIVLHASNRGWFQG